MAELNKAFIGSVALIGELLLPAHACWLPIQQYCSVAISIYQVVVHIFHLKISITQISRANFQWSVFKNPQNHENFLLQKFY